MLIIVQWLLIVIHGSILLVFDGRPSLTCQASNVSVVFLDMCQQLILSCQQTTTFRAEVRPLTFGRSFGLFCMGSFLVHQQIGVVLAKLAAHITLKPDVGMHCQPVPLERDGNGKGLLAWNTMVLASCRRCPPHNHWNADFVCWHDWRDADIRHRGVVIIVDHHVVITAIADMANMRASIGSIHAHGHVHASADILVKVIQVVTVELLDVGIQWILGPK